MLLIVLVGTGAPIDGGVTGFTCSAPDTGGGMSGLTLLGSGEYVPFAGITCAGLSVFELTTTLAFADSIRLFTTGDLSDSAALALVFATSYFAAPQNLAA